MQPLSEELDCWVMRSDAVLFESLVSWGQILVFSNVHFSAAVTALSSLTQSWKNKPPNWVGSDPCGGNWDGIRCSNSRIIELLVHGFFCLSKLIKYWYSLLLSTLLKRKLKKIALIFRKLAGLTMEGQLSSAIQSLSELDTMYMF